MNYQRSKRKIASLSTCPRCKGSDLLPFEADLICANCDWNSFAESVRAGQLDELIYDYECSSMAPFKNELAEPTKHSA